MIRVNELRGRIYAKGYSQRKLAGMLGIAEKTFYLKMKRGIFGSDEIQKMIDILDIVNPVEIFFADKATFEDTKQLPERLKANAQ
jgi:hypothetical protein